jgi:hypothetical protein
MNEKMTFDEIRALQEKTAKSLEEMRVREQERSKNLDRYEAQQAKDAAESKAAFNALREELGGMGGSNGEYAENYFAHAIEEKKVFAGQRFDEMATNLKAKHGKM